MLAKMPTTLRLITFRLLGLHDYFKNKPPSHAAHDFDMPFTYAAAIPKMNENASNDATALSELRITPQIPCAEAWVKTAKAIAVRPSAHDMT